MKLNEAGFSLFGSEPMKLTIDAKSIGYTGYEIADILYEAGIVCEFSDPDYTVLMPSVETTDKELQRLCEALLSIPKKEKIERSESSILIPKRMMSIRDAVFSASETIPTELAKGCVLAEVTVGCPPAIPILVSGEEIDDNAISIFSYYGIKHVNVVKQF